MSHIDETLLADYIVTALAGGTVDSESFTAPATVSTTLSAGMASGVSTIPVASTAGFPATGIISIDSGTADEEQLEYTSLDATNFYTATNTANAHDSGAAVANLPYSYPLVHRRMMGGLARYLNKYDEPDVSAAATFTPTLLLSGVAHGGGYTNRQGYYVKLADLIIAAIYIQTSGNISISGGSIQFSGLPEAGDMLTTLAFWPTFVSQGSLIGGALYGRLRPGTSTNIGLNDSGAQQGLTSWTFSNHLFFCSIGCVYRVS